MDGNIEPRMPVAEDEPILATSWIASAIIDDDRYQ